MYATPKVVTNIDDCGFYHSMDIPGYGTVRGLWDLRGTVDEYLGRVDFSGKRVLEVGTASGFLCFWMERRGAEVVAYDLSPDLQWDVVPFAQYDYKQLEEQNKIGIARQNNAYWFCHRAFNSNAKVVYGTVYDVPDEIGQVDITTFASVLLHVRDPFLALQQALRLTKETVIIAEMAGERRDRDKAVMTFLPDPGAAEPKDTWWRLSPQLVKTCIATLGFEHVAITYHTQRHVSGPVPYYTIVGRRTRSL